VDGADTPISTEPSIRPEGRDTPPPADLGEGHRPSRRARANVNYALPNLVTKMRRPTAELVDAVSKDTNRQSIKLEDDPSAPSMPVTIEKPKMRDIVIKRESEDAGEPNWNSVPQGKHEPASPLSAKTAAAAKRDKLQDPTSGDLSRLPSRSSATISALMSGPNGVKRRSTMKQSEGEREQEGTIQQLSKDLDNMAIYDFAGSSPTIEEQAKVAAKLKVDAIRARAARRHSSMSAVTSLRDKGIAGSTTSVSTKTGSKEVRHVRSVSMADPTANQASDSDKGGRSDRSTARRRSMIL
jgi:hypothetical protein